MAQNIHDTVVNIWNGIIETSDPDKKCTSLIQIKELIIYNNPNLLDNFYEEIMGLLFDNNANVRATVVEFMESACKADHDLIYKSVERLKFIVEEGDSFNVLKKIATAMMTIYPLSLSQAIKMKNPKPEAIEAFYFCISIVQNLMTKIDSQNGGIILMLIKLMEFITILQSCRHPESDIPKGKENDLSLDQIPNDLPSPGLKIEKLEQFGLNLFNDLIRSLNRDHFSSSHIHTLLASLTNIARQRPQFMSRVIDSFESTHATMPDRLGEIQVNSIRKALKSSLISLLKHPSCQDYLNRVSALLIDLGVSQSEITRLMPKPTEMVSLKRKIKEESYISKRQKLSSNFASDPSDLTYDNSVIKKFAPSSQSKKPNYVEQLSKELVPKLNTVINVTDLVLLSMMCLPETMPPTFQSAYTPIAAAGTPSQIAHLSRLLSAQLVSAGYFSLESKDKREAQYQELAGKSGLEDMVMSGYLSTKNSMKASKIQQNSSSKSFDLETVTHTLPVDLMQEAIHDSFERMLDMSLVNDVMKNCRINTANALSLYSTDNLNMSPWYIGRNRALTALTIELYGRREMLNALVKYCTKDIKNRFEILSTLLLQEYSSYKATQLTQIKSTNHWNQLDDYDAILCGVLNELVTSDVKETYFGRMLLEAPLLTNRAMKILQSYCSKEINADYGFTILRELFNNQFNKRKELLSIILDFSSKDSPEVRSAALNAAKWILMTSIDSADDVMERAKSNVSYLLQSRPTSDMTPLNHLTNVSSEWTDESVKPCLYLFLALMPVNHSLIHMLADVFVKSCQVVKRTIFKMIDIPIKEIGMGSEEILQLVENCDNNHVVFVIRVIHILTDKALPTPSLVEKLKDIYHKLSDVRLIIPILKGLTKAEMLNILPKLVVLNEKVVSEVFRRVLDVSAFDPAKGDFVVKTSPILPEELLVAVHQLEFANVELKVVIDASKMCFREKQIFTQERLSIVIGQLLDLPVLPTLFMRTLMQSFSMYPRMVGYVVNVLSRLIQKQVWKNSSLWDGFIRCCIKLGQQSFSVLLQLPADKLESVFNSKPEFRNQMRRYIDNCPQSQKLHVSNVILNLINSDPTASVSPENTNPSTNVQGNSNNESNSTLNDTTGVDQTTVFNVPKVEKFTSSSLAKAVMDKEKSDEERKKKEKAKQLIEKEGKKISFSSQNH